MIIPGDDGGKWPRIQGHDGRLVVVPFADGEFTSGRERLGAGCVGVRRVAGRIEGPCPVKVFRVGKPARVAVAHDVGQQLGDLGVIRSVARPFDFETEFIRRGIGPGQVDLKFRHRLCRQLRRRGGQLRAMRGWFRWLRMPVTGATAITVMMIPIVPFAPIMMIAVMATVVVVIAVVMVGISVLAVRRRLVLSRQRRKREARNQDRRQKFHLLRWPPTSLADGRRVQISTNGIAGCIGGKARF